MINNANNNIEKIKFIQINLHKSLATTPVLVQYMLEKDIDIALIQEPYTVDNIITHFPLRFQIIQSIDNPTAAIVLNPTKVKIMPLNEFITRSQVWAVLEHQNTVIHICSAYMAPSADIDLDITSIENTVNKLKPKNLIICSDTNARSQQWGDNTHNRRADSIIDFCIKNNILIINNSDIPTFMTSFGQSFIDLTFVNQNTFDSINNWRVDLTESNSDHNYIRFEYKFDQIIAQNFYNNNNRFNDLNPLIINQIDKKYCFKKFDSNCFKERIYQRLSDINSSIDSINCAEDIETLVEEFTFLIINTCNEIIPKFKKFQKSNNWWSLELTSKRRLVNRLRRRYQRCKEQQIRQIRKRIYYAERQDYIEMIRKSKLESWRRFCFESKPWGLPYKLVNSKVKIDTSIPNFKKSDGTYTSTQEESLNLFMNTMFPNDNINDDNEEHIIIRDYCRTPPETDNDINLTIIELENVINNMKPNKTSGWDQINDIIIKTIHSIEPQFLLKLFNICLRFGYFPKLWKISVIKILLKSKDKDKSEVKSYRPISLLSKIAKLFEKLIINRINHHMFSNNLLSKSQFGFTPNVSTEDALEFVHNLGRKALESKAYLLVVVLDITGAFDNCWWPQILKQLKDKKCPKNLFNIINNYLNQRTAIVKAGETIIYKNLTKGCPQGSALGPGIWNISYDELLTLSTPEDCYIKGCCDDTKLLIYGENLQTIQSKTNKLLNDIYNWGQKTKLEFNANKTSALLITRKRDKNINIEMNGINIELKPYIKYLGVFIDEKLNYNQHINYLKQKMTSKLMKMPLMTRNKWGLTYESLKLIYSAAFEPSITYCSSVWAKSLTKQNIKKLKSIQRLFAIKIIRSYRTISYESAVTIAGLTPIDLKIIEKNNLNQIKKQFSGEVLGLNCKLMERKVKIRALPHPALQPNITYLDNENNGLTFDYEVFTDGSKSDTSVGSSFCILKDGIEQTFGVYRIGPLCSVFQSELIAIKKSIEEIKTITNNTNEMKILIQTDSQSALLALKQFNNNHPLVVDIKTLLRSFNINIKFYIQWIKGHSGIAGNERADQLAKMGSELNANQSIYNYIPMSFAKRHFKTITLNEWEISWKSTTKASQTKQFFPMIRDRLELKELLPNYIISQYLSGHGDFKSYLKRFNISNSDVCDCGQSIETPNHIIFDCFIYTEERHQFVNSIHRSGHQSLALKHIVKDKEIFQHLIAFLKLLNK